MSELKQNTLLGALHSKKAHQMEETVTQLHKSETSSIGNGMG